MIATKKELDFLNFRRSAMHSRLLYLIGQLTFGGSERQLYYLLQAMDRTRYQPAVVVWNFCDEDVFVPRIRELGVPIYFFSGCQSKVTKLASLRRLVRRLGPEVIHSYSFFTNFPGYCAAWGTSSVPVGSIRSNFILDKAGSGCYFSRLNARWPRDQICNSFSAAEIVRKSQSLFIPKRLSVVPNGTILEKFRSSSSGDGEKVRILAVGSLYAVKRWDRLLVAASQLKGRGLNFLVQIVGDGPLRGKLKQKAAELGVTDCVVFLGQRNDIPDLLAQAMFLAHTSSIEGCPNVVIEAMACGRAVVAYNAGDIPILVENGKTGFVVSQGDDRVLVERMATLIRDRELCRSMGNAGRARAEREFGLPRLVLETFNTYKAAGWKD